MDNGRVIKGLSVNRTMPDVGAVARSLLGVLLVAGVALHWVGPSAAIAAGGASAIAGAVALQDSPRGQVRLVAAVSVAMAVAVVLGVTTQPIAALYALVVAAWGFGAGMTWAVSANAGLVGAAATALLVVTPTGDPPWRAAGLTLVGGLVQALLIVVWPRRRWRTQRVALTRAYRSLAADAEALATDPAHGVSVEPLIYLRDAFTLTEAQAARRPLAYRSWYGLPERLAATLTGTAGKLDDAREREAVLLAAAEVLTALAAPSTAARRASGYSLGAFDAVVASASRTGTGADSKSMVVQRLSEQLREAVALRYGEVTPPSQLTNLRRPELPGELRDVVTTVTTHLNRDSPILRHAVRLALALAGGTVIVRFADLAHGYWIPLTVVMVLRPETAHTYTRCVGRVAGNAAGIVVASVVTVLLHPTGLAAAAFAVVFLAVAYAVSAVGYVALSAALAAAVVLLLDVGGSADASTMGDRLLATLIGGTLAVLAHVALPDHAGVRLRQRAGELLKTEIDYAATVIKAYTHDLDKPADALSAAWERAYRARAAFEAAASANPTDDRAYRRWLRAYRSALNVVTAACSALESGLPPRPPAGWSEEFTAAVDDYVRALSGDPATPGAPWRADIALLTSSTERVRAAIPRSDAATARVLVGELVTITNQLATISTGPARIPDEA